MLTILTFPCYNKKSNTWLIKTTVGTMEFDNSDILNKITELAENKKLDLSSPILNAILHLINEKMKVDE